MINLSALRWGKPYESLESVEVTHFRTGEPVGKLAVTNSGILARDMRQASRARDALRQFSIDQLLDMVAKAGELYVHGTLKVGDGLQSPDDFVKAQSASTGLPEHMSRFNMEKNLFVLSHMREILEALTRGLPFEILTRGYGKESRGVTVSYQAQSPVLGLVLPNNSPGVHTLWLPVIPMQIGLVMKPGSQEPWTPYRVAAAFVEAGIPAEAIAIYPGSAEVGGAVLSHCGRSMIFGGEATVEKYKGDPRVQVHGPGFSKILLGDDVVDRWEDYLDVLAASVLTNSGRGCINCSTIWASRHTKEIAAALAKRLGPVDVKLPDDPTAELAAFTNASVAKGVWNMLEGDFKKPGVEHSTAEYGPRLVELERCAYLRPVIAHAKSPEADIVKREFMFPFTTVVECPEEKMLASIGPTLVCTAITANERFQKQLVDAVHIDRLNFGAIPTVKLDWLQPHEGNIVDFLYRARAIQAV